MKNPEILVPGFYFKNLIKMVKAKKGQKGIKELEKLFGDLHFLAFKKYPAKLEARFHDEVCKVVYNDNSPESYRKIGKLAFEAYINSIVGKTTFSLLGRDIKHVALNATKLLETVSKEIQAEIIDLGPNSVCYHIKNLPYRIEYYQGICSATIEYLGYKPEVRAKVLEPNCFEYILSWKK